MLSPSAHSIPLALLKDPFVPHLARGMKKSASASRRRPGKLTANHYPSCTARDARKFVGPGRRFGCSKEK